MSAADNTRAVAEAIWDAVNDSGIEGRITRDDADYLAGIAVAAATDLPNAYWNGLPAKAERGTAIVADAPEFPLYWARDLIGQRIPVVQVVLDGVTYGGGVDYLDNRDGTGWHKVTEGKGSPRYPHGSVAIVPGSFVGGEDQ